jgi:hypothetical protein
MIPKLLVVGCFLALIGWPVFRDLRTLWKERQDRKGNRRVR